MYIPRAFSPGEQAESAWQSRTFSSTSGSMFPMNKLAPTSCVFLSWLALFTRMGLPYTLIIFRILMACRKQQPL